LLQGVNGSGKHNNWSIATNDGTNLLNVSELAAKSGTTEIFPVVMAAIIQAFYKHGDLLRMAVACPGNDFRLGACEAPPAIVSTHLGDHMTAYLKHYVGKSLTLGLFVAVLLLLLLVFLVVSVLSCIFTNSLCDVVISNAIANANATANATATANGACARADNEDTAAYSAPSRLLDLGAGVLPPVEVPAEDRNRTSLLPYGGHRFEFRAVGSSQNVSLVNTVVATAVSNAFKQFADAIEKGATPKAVAQEALKKSWPV
jgi:glutamine synthetase type III